MGQSTFRPPMFTGTLDFIVTFVSVIIGLGNFWRFPFLAYENGGGAYVFAYILLYFLVGKPVMLLEMALGQFSRKGNITTFYRLSLHCPLYEGISLYSTTCLIVGDLCAFIVSSKKSRALRFGPAYTGIGVTQLCANIFVLSYYAVVVAICLYYFSQSFHEVLPWTQCHEEWDNFPSCVPRFSSIQTNVTNSSKMLSSEQMYLKNIIFVERLDLTNGIGTPNWGVAVALFVVWMFAYINLRFGITGLGFFNYFFCWVPWIAALMLAGKALTLPGSSAGVKHFFTIDWKLLSSAQLWLAASAQVIFSVGIGFGTTSMYASYSCTNTNIKTASTIICVLDALISLIIGIVVFATVANISHELQTDFRQVVVTGRTAFVFIVYPYLMSTYLMPSVASAMFFMTLSLTGIDSLVSFVNVITSQFIDILPNCLSYRQITFAVSFIGFLSGLPYLTPQGQLFLRTVDFFGGTMIVCMISMLECLVITYGYGMRQFCWDIEYTVGERPDLVSILGWRIPGVIIVLDVVVFIMGVSEMRHAEHAVHELLVVAGWIMLITACLPIPLLACSTIVLNYKKGCPKMIKCAISTHRWKPGDPQDFYGYRYFISEKRKELAQRRYKNVFARCWDSFIGY